MVKTNIRMRKVKQQVKQVTLNLARLLVLVGFSGTDDLLGLSLVVICRVYKKLPSEEHLSCI